MSTADIIQFVGVCLGCWASGYCAGFSVYSIRRFMEQI